MRRNDGMTMVEIAVILAVLGLLVGLVASAAGDLLEESHVVRTQEEVDRIGRAIVEFYADTGYFPRTNDTFDGRPGDQEVGALISAAPLPGSTTATRRRDKTTSLRTPTRSSQWECWSATVTLPMRVVATISGSGAAPMMATWSTPLPTISYRTHQAMSRRPDIGPPRT